MKRLYLLILVCAASCLHAGERDTSVLLAPIDASQTAKFEWGVVVLTDPIPIAGSSADRGSLKVNLDLAKFFQEGFAIYSITKLEKKDQGVPALLVVLVRPKK